MKTTRVLSFLLAFTMLSSITLAKPVNAAQDNQKPMQNTQGQQNTKQPKQDNKAQNNKDKQPKQDNNAQNNKDKQPKQDGQIKKDVPPKNNTTGAAIELNDKKDDQKNVEMATIKEVLKKLVQNKKINQKTVAKILVYFEKYGSKNGEKVESGKDPLSRLVKDKIITHKQAEEISKLLNQKKKNTQNDSNKKPAVENEDTAKPQPSTDTQQPAQNQAQPQEPPVTDNVTGTDSPANTGDPTDPDAPSLSPSAIPVP